MSKELTDDEWQSLSQKEQFAYVARRAAKEAIEGAKPIIEREARIDELKKLSFVHNPNKFCKKYSGNFKGCAKCWVDEAIKELEK